MATSRKAETVDKSEVPEAIDFNYKGWRPQPGDTIEGVLGAITWAHSEYGRYPLLTLTGTNVGDEVDVHAFHTSLKNQLIEMQPKLGDGLTIRYNGQIELVDKDGLFKTADDGTVKTMHDYSVSSPNYVFDWNRF